VIPADAEALFACRHHRCRLQLKRFSDRPAPAYTLSI